MAGQVKFCLGFLFHPRRKTTYLIENDEIHVTPETIFIYSAILARTAISKHSAILKGTFYRILRFWQREEINRKQDIRRRRVFRLGSSFRVCTHQANEFTVHSACETNQDQATTSATEPVCSYYSVLLLLFILV